MCILSIEYKKLITFLIIYLYDSGISTGVRLLAPLSQNPAQLADLF